MLFPWPARYHPDPVSWFTHTFTYAPGVLLAAGALLAGGCSPRPLLPGQEGPHPDPKTGRYGELALAPSNTAPPALALRSLKDVGWEDAPFAVLQTELSPAMLIQSQAGYLGLFRDLQAFGLESPSHVAFSAREGPRAYMPGDTMNVLDMEECWLVVWFGGGLGWTDWDSPWAVFLQHKPLAMKLDGDGLHLQFRRQAGQVVVMPLYGYEKLKPFEEESETKRAKDAPPVTADWSEALTRDLLMRVRYWAGVARMLPVHVRETYQLDRARDTIRLRQSFAWHAIPDEWKTPALKLAPVPPALALAMQAGSLPVEFSSKPFDLKMVTPSGPYLGVQNVDAYDISLRVLDLVHETEQSGLRTAPTNHVAKDALARLHATVRPLVAGQGVPSLGLADHDDAAALLRRAGWLAKALPWLDEETRALAVDALTRQVHDPAFSETLLDPNSAGGDAGARLAFLWEYGERTGDWDWIRSHWDRIRRLAPRAAQVSWAACGDGQVIPMGEGAAPRLALARLAYRIGDAAMYEDACYQLGGHLIRQHAKLTGSAYVRKHQPWHHPDPIPEEVYLNQLLAGPEGWQLDGPGYPAGANDEAYKRRWLQFTSEDVARFHRRHAAVWAFQELSRLSPGDEGGSELVMSRPPLDFLRSILLNATPDQLGRMPGAASSPRDPVEIMAEALARLRTSQPVLVERLVPSAPPGPWRLGLEPDAAEVHPSLVVRLNSGGATEGQAAWPRPEFGGAWFTPNEDPRTVGRWTPVQEGEPASLRVEALNWNTRVWLYKTE